jgi:prepilin-type N-terminal cleavage/methylation domain-containing protein
MRTPLREDGFTLTELLISTTIMLLVLSTAMTTFKNAVGMNQAATQTADANQNLRAGMNLLVRDLLQAARGIPTGGIPIPHGSGALQIKRPTPPPTVGMATQLYFDNTTTGALPAIITGAGKGPTIDGETTDIITILMTDTLLGTLDFNNANAGPPAVANTATLAANGSSINTAAGVTWLAGDPANGIPAVAVGDLMWIQNPTGGTIQTVTAVTAAQMRFTSGSANDYFNFNQPAAAAGSITNLLPVGAAPMPQGTATRIIMLTYFVDAVTTLGTPRLTKVVNGGTPQALAGVVEDLRLFYDIVDGGVNPVNVPDLPATISGTTYSPNQIRKVSVHVGVRSDTLSAPLDDYIRNHLTTVVSIRSLAFVNRYY